VTVRLPALAVAGMAGVVIVALALHVLMLAGVGIADSGHHPASGVPTAAAAHGGDAGAAVRTPHPHLGHAHLLVECMALVAVLGLALLIARARRTPPHRGHRPPPRRWPARHVLFVRGSAPPGPLVARGVLLRV
jgi:hypothetical protein